MLLKTFIMIKYLFIFLIMLTFSSSTSYSQQQYSENSVMDCNQSDETGPSPSFLYTCNNNIPSCKAFLMFKAKPPYISISSISNLTSSNPLEISRINNISISSILPLGLNVIIPVTCSCLGQYYQANTSYISSPVDNTYFTIANLTYQGLTTCNALKRANPYGEFDLFPGFELEVPLRCACPTHNQTTNGTKFLLTYLVTWNDTVPKISEKFNVSAKSVAIANGFLDEDPTIYPFTTILVPIPTEPLVSFQTNTTSYPNTVPNKRKNETSYKGLYVGVIIGAALSIFCFVLFVGVFYYRRRKNEASSEIRHEEEKQISHFLKKVVQIGEILKTYTYEELEAATNNFSSQKKLSDSIYHGFLRGKSLAIKKVVTHADVSKEIKILGNINHFNLISLYGVCEHDNVFYLVYEYLEEGNLRNWLHKDESVLRHTWNNRICIALDIANGLDYLHNFTDPAYVHKNISSRNILLNKDLRAKITNFNLARENGDSNSTSCVVGEKGYMAPEYVQASKVTPKIDVYALGVVLLELITGKEAVFVRDGEEIFLSDMVILGMDGVSVGTEIVDLIDTRLQVKHPLGYVIDHSELALRLLRLCLACLVREPDKRLSMVEVVSALRKIQLDVCNSQLLYTE